VTDVAPLTDDEIRLLVDKLDKARKHAFTCVLSSKEAAYLCGILLEDTANAVRADDEFIDEDPEQEGDPN